jgi:hypothetical protein
MSLFGKRWTLSVPISRDLQTRSLEREREIEREREKESTLQNTVLNVECTLVSELQHIKS